MPIFSWRSTGSSSWSLQTDPTGIGSELMEVSCQSAIAGTAVGDNYDNSAGVLVTLAERRDGNT